MIHTIREAFNELLADNDWMDDETRTVAKQKADAMNERIGYPELLTNPEELSKEYVMVRPLCNDSNTVQLLANLNTSAKFKRTFWYI
jgi:predicted metalloendopeptidase